MRGLAPGFYLRCPPVGAAPIIYYIIVNSVSICLLTLYYTISYYPILSRYVISCCILLSHRVEYPIISSQLHYILLCIVLSNITLQYIILYYTALEHLVLHYVIIYYIILFY